jgi:RepB DNA-primase from phage plasmid
MNEQDIDRAIAERNKREAIENGTNVAPTPAVELDGERCESDVDEAALEPNLGDISEFFEMLRSCGATRVVTAALDDTKPSGRQMTAHPFRLDDPALTQRVVARNLNKENLYWCSGDVADDWRGPNPPTIEQITGNRAAHSDCDFHVDESFELGYPRVLALVGKLVAEGKLLPPSMTVFSGGGFQFYWFGTAPIAPDETASCNRYINRLTGGDHTHNCNRLLRIPGTVNWLNAKKRERGRVPTLSKIVREVTA